MSRLVSVNITPLSDIVAPTGFVDFVKSVGKIDIADNDELIEQLVPSAFTRLAYLTGYVPTRSTVTSTYMQNKGGTLVELFYCNGINLEGLEDYSIKGTGGKLWLQVSGKKTIDLTYEAGWTEIPRWFLLAAAKDIIYHIDNPTAAFESNGTNYGVSPDVMAFVSPYILTLHNIVM